MAYCIMRVEKRKRSALYGLQIEANRTAADHERGRDFAASDINWELTPFNLFLVKAENWGKAVTAALEEAKVQERKNSVVVLDGFYGASPEWFLDKTLDEVVDYFKDCLAFHEKAYGKVINAVIHFDEATPHLTCQSLPIIDKENGILWHNGGTGNYNCYLGFQPETGTAVVVLSNLPPSYRIPATVLGIKALHELGWEFSNQVDQSKSEEMKR